MRRPPSSSPFRLRLIATVLASLVWAAPAFSHHFGVKASGGKPDDEADAPADCDPSIQCCDQGPTPGGETDNSPTSPSPTGANPVDFYTGRKVLQIEDLVVPGVVPIRMVREYNSQSRYDSPLGYGWTFTYDLRLFEHPVADGRVTVRAPEGRRFRYVPTAMGATTYEPLSRDSGRIPELERLDPPDPEGVEFVMTYANGERALFDTEGRLYALKTPQGNRLRFFYSNEKKELTGMSPFAVNPSTTLTVGYVWQITEIKEQLRYKVGTTPEEFTGRTVTFTYDSNGRIDYIESHDGRRVDYDYNETVPFPDDLSGAPGYRGNLAQVIGAHDTTPPGEAGIVETYRYPATPSAGSTRAALEHIHNLTYYDDGAGTEPHVATYDPDNDRVATQSYGPSGGAFADWSFLYVDDAETGERTTTITRTIRTPGAADKQAVSAYTFNPHGMLIEKVDALGNRLEFDRPMNACPKEVRVYEAAQPTSPSRTITSTFKTDGRLLTRRVALSGANETIVTSQDYFGPGPFLSFREITSEPASKVFRTEFEYFVDGDGLPENLQFLKQQTATPDDFIVTEFTYHADHGQLETVEPPAVTPADHLKIRRLYYDASDNSAEIIREGLLKEIQIIADDGINPIAVDDHLRRQFDYDAAGNIDTITDSRAIAGPDGLVTDLDWDGRGRLVRRTHRIGATSTTWESILFRYGAPNDTSPPTAPANDAATPGHHLLQVEVGALGADGTATAGRIRRLLVDSRGRVTRIERKDGANYLEFASFGYDSDGNRVESSQPTEGTTRRTLTFSFDRMRRLATIQDGAENLTQFEYDALGNRTKITDAGTQVTDFVYDELDRLIQVIQQGESLTTTFGYDPAGNVTTVQDPKSQTTTYAYDELSRLTSVTQQLSQAVSYRYDDRGRLDRIQNARGQVLRYLYLPWGGLNKLVYDEDDDGESPQDRVIAYTYDFNGNLRTTSDGGSQLWDLTYDELNRVDVATAHYITPATPKPSLNSDYDRFGDRTALTLTDGHATSPSLHSWSFDDRDRLEAVCMPQDEACSPGDETLRFLHFENDDLKQTIHEIGAPTDLLTSYLYHPEAPIESITVSLLPPGPNPIHQLAYTVDEVLNVESFEETIDADVQSYAYEYDNTYRLIDADYPLAPGFPVPDEHFAYDPAGNRDDADPVTGMPLGTHGYDRNNRITASPSRGYEFDDDGNLIEVNDGMPTPTVLRALTFDATSRLRQVVDATTGTSSYTYDPFGRRTQKTSGGTTTYYLWDGDRLLAEYDGTGARHVRYAYAGGFAPVQVAYDDGASSEDVYHVHTDHLDTPRMLTNGAGDAVWRASYSAFGTANLSHPDTVLANPFNIRFPGQYFDEETGLHYNRHRYYDPSIGRYASADPVGQFGALRWQRIALSRPPLNEASPTSLLPIAQVESDALIRRSSLAFGRQVQGDLVDAPGVASGLGTGPLVLGITDSNVFPYGLANPLNTIDPTGEYLVAAVLAVAAAAAIGYSLWAYSRAAEACREYCADLAARDLCLPGGESRCIQNCMARGNRLITSTGGGSTISTEVGRRISEVTDD